MVKKIRKPLALFLALVMCLSMVNFTALASETADHEHNADGWTCTQAEPVKTLNCEEDHEHGDECYTVTESEWTCVAPVVEETPAEVQAFLNAVAAIPAITAENAAEVAEYVYGPVSEAYEALLGTGYEERADVQEAVAAYAAAIEAVDAALDMYSSELASGYIPVENVGIYPDKKPTGNTATGKVRYSNQSLTMKVGQRASFLLGAPTNELYHLNSWGYKHTIAVYNPSDYCDISLIDNSGNNIVGNPTYAAGDNQGTRVFDTVFEALKPGVSNDVRVCYYTNFGIVFANGADFAYIPCPVCGASKLVYKDVTWYRYNDVFGITVNADYVLNLDPNGGTVSPTSERKTVASTSCTFSLPTPTHPEGKTFLGWSDGTNTYTGSYTLNWSEGYGSEANPVTGSLTAVWEDAETYTVTYTDGVTGETVFADQGYEGLKVGDATPGFEGGTPTRENYTFMGWSPAVNPVVSADDADDDGNIVYTATWTKNPVIPETPDLTVTKTAVVAGPVEPGDQFYYQITVTNNGSAVQNVVITDKLDSNLEFVSASGPNNIYLVGAENKPANDQYAIGNLAAVNESNSTKTLTITVRVKDGATGTIKNTATADCDGMPEDNKPSDEATVTVKGLTLSLKVEKTNEGFQPNADGDGASVKYTVKVTNESDIDLYGLKLTDVMTVSPAASDNGVTYTFRDWKIGETTPEIISGTATDLTHTLWVVDRNTLFAKGTSVTLTYTVDIVNNGDDDVEVKLDNGATGESWKAQKPAAYKVRSFIMPLTDDDPSDVSGTGSSSAGGTGSGSSTGGTLSGKKYTVTYSWNLPAGADRTKPVDAKYKKGEQVAVDTEYTNGTTVTVGTKIYTFSGWSTEDATIAEGKFTMPAGNVTISGTWTHTHVWTEKTDDNDHTVWADGKAPTCTEDGTAIYECACGETKEAVKEGSKLGHDFTDATPVDNCTSHEDAACTGHTLTCTRCNGSLEGGTKTEAHDMKEVPNSAVAPTRDTAGKEADMKCSKCDHVVIGAAIPALGEVTIKIEFTDEDGNVVGTEEKFVTKGDQYDVTEEAKKLPEGYEANGTPTDLTGTADSDKTVTVPVKKIEYTVIFNSNGGSAVENQTVKHGEKATQPAAPTRENYRFDGWYLGNEAYDFNTPVTGNIELVAQWTYVPPYVPDPDYTYTLNYNANGGVGAPASQSQTNDRNFTVSAVEPTREGYTFAGWATAANAEEAAYQPGSQIRINTGYSLTLHAVWTPVEDVDETEPPLVETPETTEPTETPDEGEDLGDNDTPLTELPETSEPPVEPTETPEAQEPDESEDLGDNDTPLAEVPQTGDALGLWIVLALCSAAGLAWIALTEKKGKRVA